MAQVKTNYVKRIHFKLEQFQGYKYKYKFNKTHTNFILEKRNNGLCVFNFKFSDRDQERTINKQRGQEMG